MTRISFVAKTCFIIVFFLQNKVLCISEITSKEITGFPILYLFCCYNEILKLTTLHMMVNEKLCSREGYTSPGRDLQAGN